MINILDMRLKDIKFKAKKLSDDSWVEGDLVTLENNKVCIHYLNKLTDDAAVDVYHPVDPTTVCQYTGLKDKDGKAIWEHDLLKNQLSDILYEVVWNEKYAIFTLNYFKCEEYMTAALGLTLDNIGFKVVGNKFDKEV